MLPLAPLRVIFMGTPAFSVPCFEALLADASIEVLGVITQPDRPAGRGKKLQASPVKVLAEAHQLPVLQPERLRLDDTVMAWIEAQQADALITIAFGQILPTRVLQASRLGTINVHASLLPAYRGANPIQWAVWNGDAETGLTTMISDEGVDTGAMLLKEACPIANDDTTGSLADTLAAMAGPLLLRTLAGLRDGSVQPTPQDNALQTQAPKLKKEASELNWQQPAEALCRQLRALTPWPSATATLTDAASTRIKLHQARPLNAEQKAALKEVKAFAHQGHCGEVVSLCKEGVVVQAEGSFVLLERVQPPSKGVQPASNWGRSSLLPLADAGIAFWVQG